MIYALLKRGIYGVYQDVSPHHLKRYLAEFDRRYNARKLTDAERIAKIIKAAEGRRLLYRASDSAQRGVYSRREWRGLSNVILWEQHDGDAKKKR